MASVSISCPSCSATDGVVRNGKSTALLVMLPTY
ncbi:Transposase [Shigella dysenteriae 1617]|uniref:Transposase n=1 Tax=Shigella dysenteriae 1617 TaxID=754093 RepID=A0A0A6ZRW0_SHIDY|nr:Transposase [Shigella dysenteriae 1617]